MVRRSNRTSPQAHAFQRLVSIFKWLIVLHKHQKCIVSTRSITFAIGVKGKRKPDIRSFSDLPYPVFRTTELFKRPAGPNMHRIRYITYVCVVLLYFESIPFVTQIDLNVRHVPAEYVPSAPKRYPTSYSGTCLQFGRSYTVTNDQSSFTVSPLKNSTSLLNNATTYCTLRRSFR